jgi:hypothetical protein
MYIVGAVYSCGQEASFSDGGMDIIRILWIINFFLFLLTLIFIWSKLLSISQRIDEIVSVLKKCNEIPPVEN